MPTQSITIQTLERRPENFQGKVVDKLIINGKWSAFAGKWNADWYVGGMAKGIFTEKVINGRTYYNIGCPPELRPQQMGQGIGNETLNQILIELKAIHSLLEFSLKPKEIFDEVDQGETPADTDVPIEEIPF